MADRDVADHRQKDEVQRSVARVFYADPERQDAGTVRAILDQLGAEIMEFPNAMECLGGLSKCECHLLIINARRPYSEGMELLRGARRLQPSVPVIVLVDHGDVDAAVRAIKDGATDCLGSPVETDQLAHLIDELLDPIDPYASRSGPPLTPVETTVLQHILKGSTTRQIAKTLCRSPRTIEGHRSAIMRKLNVDSTVALVKKCIRLGLLRLYP